VTPRLLGLSAPAARDIARRARYLAAERGEAFCERFAVEIKRWLEGLAAGGAQLGTALGDDPSVRSFGYLKQATIVARFEPGRLIVIRVYFKGQDWSRGPARR
jgi:plasmid stabilization system protein ParE